MNKAELLTALRARLGSGKAAADALHAVLEEITQAVAKGDDVRISGFGVFEKRERAARTARNPRTGETVRVGKSSAPAFRAAQAFKNFVRAFDGDLK